MSVARGAPPCARLQHFRPSPQGEQMGGLPLFRHSPSRHWIGPQHPRQPARAAAPTGRHVPPIVSTPPPRPPPAVTAPQTRRTCVGGRRRRWPPREGALGPGGARGVSAPSSSIPPQQVGPATAEQRRQVEGASPPPAFGSLAAVGWGGGWGAAPSATGPAAQICNRRGGGGGAAELAAWLVWGAADEPPGGAAPPAPTRAPLGARARRRPHDSHQQPKREGVEQRHTIGQSFKILAHHWPRLLFFAPRGLLRQKNWATPWITKRARLSAARAQSGGAKSGCEATVGRLSLARGALCLPPPPSPHRRGSAYRLEPPLPARARRWWSRG